MSAVWQWDAYYELYFSLRFWRRGWRGGTCHDDGGMVKGSLLVFGPLGWDEEGFGCLGMMYV